MVSSGVPYPDLIMWLAAASAMAWKVSQLARRPNDPHLRAVAACMALVATALTVQLATDTVCVLASTPKLIQNVLLVSFFALLLTVLSSVGAAAGDRTVERHIGQGFTEPALAVAAVLGLVLTYAASGDERGAAYGDSINSGVTAFYLVGNLYLTYSTARGAHLTFRAADHGRGRAVRTSLRVAGAGLLVCCLGAHVPRICDTATLLVFDLYLWPDAPEWTSRILAAGIVLFFLGIGYPGVRSSVLLTRLRLQQRRTYRALEPLWTMLSSHFPEIVLPLERNRSSAFVDAVWLTHLRYNRRITECRDGLIRAAAQLPIPVENLTLPQQADALRRALAHSRRYVCNVSTPPSGVFAQTAEKTIEADTSALVEFAQIAYGRSNPAGGNRGLTPRADGPP